MKLILILKLIFLDRQSDSIEPGSRSRLVNLRSRITIVGGPTDNGHSYSCRGRHPTVDDSRDKLSASITISVLRKYFLLFIFHNNIFFQYES